MANSGGSPAHPPTGVREDSLAKRYGFKLGASLLGLPLGLAQQWVVTRALGPSGYGSYSFLNSFFTEVIAFFDSGTSAGFYAKLCGRPTEQGLVASYWRLAGAVTGILFVGVAVVLLVGLAPWFWPAQKSRSVLLALFCGIGIWLTLIAGKIVDAHGCTTRGEKARLLYRLVSVALVGLLFVSGLLTLDSLFLLQGGLAAFLLYLWQRALRQAGFSLAPRLALMPGETRQYGREFWEYSHPLLIYSLVGTFAAVADRWLLQRLAGTIEQGFYGLALQIGSFCFLFTSAVVPLLARDFAQAHQSGESQRIALGFKHHLPRFYAIAACLGVFMAAESDHIAAIVGGDEFAHAGTATALMCLYPIHQTYGQISGSFFYATGKPGFTEISG